MEIPPITGPGIVLIRAASLSAEGNQDRQKGSAADHAHTIYAGNRHYADIFAVGSRRYGTDHTGDRSGKVISKDRTVKSRIFDQVFSYDFTGHDLMSDVFGSDDQNNRQDGEDRFGFEFRQMELRDCKPGCLHHFGKIQNTAESSAI